MPHNTPLPHNNLQKELARKTIHLCACFVPLCLKHFKATIIVVLSLILLVYVVAEYFRYKGKNIILLSAITKFAARERDENKFVLGPVTMAIGVLLASILFNHKSATIAIYALAFGDGIASVVGKFLGKHTIPFCAGKTFEGSLACFGAIFSSTYYVTQNHFHSLIIAFVATTLELLPINDFDNLIIPVAVGFVCSLIIV